MDTIVMGMADGRRRRRRHSEEFKARVVQACRIPGVSIAGAAFKAMLEAELGTLTPYNWARYRVTIGEVQAWIERGRPR